MPLVIKLSRSIRLAALILITHAGGLVCLWLAPLPLAGQLLATVPAVFSAAYYLRRYALLRNPHSIVLLERHAGGWLLTDRRNVQYPARFTADSMRSRMLTLLLFQTEGRRKVSVPIFRDMLDCDDYRRLQLYLTIMQDTELPDG
jgi:hypothetical protein